MTDDLTALSRLLDGDLPDAEADALRRRIEADPKLKARWALMQQLPGQIGALPDEPEPAPANRSGSYGWSAGMALALAAAMLGWLIGSVQVERPQVVLGPGIHRVAGSADLQLGNALVAIDGISVIDVEPLAGTARIPRWEESMKKSTSITALGALAGIAVIAGTARLVPLGDGPPVELTEGQDVRWSGLAARPRTVPTPEPAPDEGPAEDVEALKAELAWLRSVTDPMSGPPPTWSDAPYFQPSEVESIATEAFPGMDLALDCREFPCIAVLETGPEWPPELAQDVEANHLPLDAYAQVGRQVADAGLVDPKLTVTTRHLPDGGYRVVVTWLTEALEAEVSDRLGARVQLVAEHGYVPQP